MLMAPPFYSPVVNYQLAIFCLICAENKNAQVKAKFPEQYQLFLNGLDDQNPKIVDLL